MSVWWMSYNPALLVAHGTAKLLHGKYHMLLSVHGTGWATGSGWWWFDMLSEAGCQEPPPPIASSCTTQPPNYQLARIPTPRPPGWNMWRDKTRVWPGDNTDLGAHAILHKTTSQTIRPTKVLYWNFESHMLYKSLIKLETSLLYQNILCFLK